MHVVLQAFTIIYVHLKPLKLACINQKVSLDTTKQKKPCF